MVELVLTGGTMHQDEQARLASTEFRAVDEGLQATHLLGVAEDDAAAVALQVEAARLILYGSLATVAGALTAVWGEERTVCISAMSLGLLSLGGAVGASWTALLLSESHRRLRAARKYTCLSHARAKVFGVEAGGKSLQDYAGDEARAWKDELRSGNAVRVWTVIASSLAAGGAAQIVVTAVNSLAGKPTTPSSP